jgi:multidrug efflux pump subunit AcrB
VVVTIPLALLTAVVALWATGQTINIMTLGGLALAVGILVDEATVAIENTHTHLSRGTPKARAVLDASGEVVVPRLLAMLSVVAVFVPSFFMTGVTRSLFVPLSLAVGFAMIASFLLSSSLVPVLSVWWLRGRHSRGDAAPEAPDWVGRLRDRLASLLRRLAPARVAVVALYLAVSIGVVVSIGSTLGARSSLRAASRRSSFDSARRPGPSSKRRTARADVLDVIRDTAGQEHVAISLGYVGVQPSSYPINTIFLWTGGAHEGVLQVALRSDAPMDLSSLQETLRTEFRDKFPDAQFSFEPGDIVSRIMNFSAPTPVEVAVMGPDFAASQAFAATVRAQLASISSLRDLQYGQTLEYPAIQVNVDRRMAGQLGLTVDQVGRSFAAATSSSRFVAPNYWADPRSGIAFQVQVEVPQPRMTTLEDLRVVPVTAGGAAKPLLGDLARIDNATIVGEYDRVNGQRMVTLTANVSGEDLGRATRQVQAAIQRAGRTTSRHDGHGARTDRGHGRDVPQRYDRHDCRDRGDLPAPGGELSVGTTRPRGDLNGSGRAGGRRDRALAHGYNAQRAVVHGVDHGDRRGGGQRDPAGDLRRAGPAARRSTRRDGHRGGTRADAAGAHDQCGHDRRHGPHGARPGRRRGAAAPLGRAVIGGLAGATVATLLVLPFVYALLQRSTRATSPSLDPDDPDSAFRTHLT